MQTAEDALADGNAVSKIKNLGSRALVAHACNPSYLGD
jgi:hypothetical protein